MEASSKPNDRSSINFLMAYSSLDCDRFRPVEVETFVALLPRFDLPAEASIRTARIDQREAGCRPFYVLPAAMRAVVGRDGDLHRVRVVNRHAGQPLGVEVDVASAVDQLGFAAISEVSGSSFDGVEIQLAKRRIVDFAALGASGSEVAVHCHVPIGSDRRAHTEEVAQSGAHETPSFSTSTSRAGQVKDVRALRLVHVESTVNAVVPR